MFMLALECIQLSICLLSAERMSGWTSLLHRDFSAGSLKTECHGNLHFIVQTENPAGTLPAVGTEMPSLGQAARSL